MRLFTALLMSVWIIPGGIAPGREAAPSGPKSAQLRDGVDIGSGQVSPDGVKTQGDPAAEAEKSRASSLPELPVWSPSDFDKLRKGEIVAGRDFFAPAPVDPDATIEPFPLEEVVDQPTEIPVPEVDETVIPSEFLTEYFEEMERTPEGDPVFLTDPQDLLSQQETRDRESFLRYHAGDSNVDLFVYLFDGRQELPAGTSADEIYQNLLEGDDPVAVVFYYLGAPGRTKVYLSQDIQAVISEDEQKRALQAAIGEAFEKSDAASQLDNFLIELSIRLYWIERELKTAAPAQIAGSELDAATEVIWEAEGESGWPVGRVVKLGVLMGALGVLVLSVWSYLGSRRTYHFPEVDCSPLMGAPHAAGVGAVISFSNSRIPPSKQREQVPEYLERM